MTREDRERLDLRIRRQAIAFSIAAVDAATIDRVNIYQATRIAMLEAVLGLAVAPDHLIIDAMVLDHPCAQTKLFYGDALCISIAAASVIAKVHRDAMMCEMHEQYPHYGLASHKGYGTPEHRRALAEHGPCPLHRRSFAPVYAADKDAVLDEAVESGDLFPDDLLAEQVASEETAWA